MNDRLQPLILAALTLLAIPALDADVTLRYKTEIKLNPSLPAQVIEQAMKGMNTAVPKESLLQLKGGKGFSSAGVNSTICDFPKQELTLLDPEGKRYATLPVRQYEEEMAAAMPQMPPEQKAAMAAMKSHVESKATGRTATIQGVEAEEHEVVITVEGPLMPNAPAGPLVRVVMHLWTAKAGEAVRNQAIREMTGYSLFAVATMNPVASMEKMFQMMPGFADTFTAVYKGLQSGGTSVILRMQMDMFMPMFGALLKQMPAGASPFGASFDPNTAFVQLSQELTEISPAAVPDSVFQVPVGYTSAAAADLIHDIIRETQPTSK
ncbi:MAG TPA: hypothetical protein VG096_14055 [Bryobacteraceae bacterium]|jgi:hypothetical protein|nr:hypothetical protein [Bryobacteraceae bacterium]